MKKNISLLLSLLFSISIAYAQKEWIYLKEKDGVKIYKRQIDKYHEVKLVTHFNVVPAALVKFFNSVSEYSKWGYKVVHSELLKRVSDTEFYYYATYDFPWPLDDRDAIMHSKITTDADTKIVTLVSNAVPDYMPEKSGLVRVRKATVNWKLTPKTGNSTEGEYTLSTDPGGLVPDWSVELANDTGPMETVAGMKKLLSEARYKNVK